MSKPDPQDDELDKWSFAKELEASLMFEYMAPHNRHKPIKGEIDRLMYLHNKIAEKRELLARKSELEEIIGSEQIVKEYAGPQLTSTIQVVFTNPLRDRLNTIEEQINTLGREK